MNQSYKLYFGNASARRIGFALHRVVPGGGLGCRENLTRRQVPAASVGRAVGLAVVVELVEGAEPAVELVGPAGYAREEGEGREDQQQEDKAEGEHPVHGGSFLGCGGIGPRK